MQPRPIAETAGPLAPRSRRGICACVIIYAVYYCTMTDPDGSNRTAGRMLATRSRSRQAGVETADLRGFGELTVRETGEGRFKADDAQSCAQFRRRLMSRSGSDPIVAYYSGGPDAGGRMLAEILAWNDERLEAVHDFIQWVFPTRQPSG